jgi:hypothetical protein
MANGLPLSVEVLPPEMMVKIPKLAHIALRT